jgi:uncharacterized protein (TIGR02246 family)
MLRTASITAGVACLLLAACQPPNKLQPLTAADSTAIAKIATDYVAAWNKGNVDGVVALYTADAVRQLQDTVVLKGANAIRTYLNTAMGTPLRPTLAIQVTSTIGRQDLAVSAGTFTLTPPAPPAPAKGAAQAAPAPIVGKWNNVTMKQADGSWKAVLDAVTYDAPRVAPAAPAKGRH